MLRFQVLCACSDTRVSVELSSLLVNMKREAQGAVSIALRTALWNWIEYFPREYLDIFKGVRRLEGAPERVFDMLFQMTENQSKRAFWPTLTVLLAASPERLKQSSLGVSKSKKVCCRSMLPVRSSDSGVAGMTRTKTKGGVRVESLAAGAD